MSVERLLTERVEKALEAESKVEALVAACLELGEPLRADLLRLIEERARGLLPLVVDHLQQLRDLGLGVEEGADEETFPEELGDFQLLRRIGAGGMGVVYLAEQISLKRQVAIKLVRPGHLYFPGTRERFRREVEAVALLEHQGIVPIYAVGEEEGIPYYAMQWLEGASLANVLLSAGNLSPERLSRAGFESALLEASGAERALDTASLRRALPGETWVQVCLLIVTRIAEALEHAHQRGVIHRDIKPSNIFLTLEGRVLLLDFGLAASEGTARITRSGAVVGTLPYMSPEQVRGGNQDMDRRSDVYSLGVVLYELLTLRLPYLGPTTEVVRDLILRAPPPSLRHANPLISEDIETVCLKALERDRTRRYPTAARFAADLEHAAHNRPIEARPPSLARRAALWSRRNKEKASVLALLVLLSILTTLFALVERASRQEIERLSDLQRYEALLASMNAFWPADPGALPAMEAWVADASALLEHNAAHKQNLETLRDRATPYSESERAADERLAREHVALVHREFQGIKNFVHTQYGIDYGALEQAEHSQQRIQDFERILTDGDRDACSMAAHALLEEMQSLRFLLPDSQNYANEVNQILHLEQMLSDDLEEFQSRRTWHFASTVEAWRHVTLAKLVQALDQLPESIQQVQTQMAHARQLEAQSPRIAPLWNRAIESIASLPAYAGLRIRSQNDLEPLGSNPDSGLWEFLLLPSGDPPEPMAADQTSHRPRVDENTGVILVLIPGGRTWIGQDRKPEDSGYPMYSPRLEVLLDPYLIAKYELTIGQAERLGWAGGPRIDKDKRLPLTESWGTFDLLFRRNGLALPTEAQWEHACRAGTSAGTYRGDSLELLEGYENLPDQSFKVWCIEHGKEFTPWFVSFDDGHAWPAPVGSFLPNPFGLHDMLGNAVEWCREVAVTRAYKTMVPRIGDGFFATVHASSPVGYVTRGLAADRICASHVPASSHRSFSQMGAEWGARPVRAVGVER